MPSLTDIPADLVNNPDKSRFISWLTSKPIDFNHRRALAQLWQSDTGIKFNFGDWELLRQTIPQLRL